MTLLFGALVNSVAIVVGTFAGSVLVKKSKGFEGETLIQIMSIFVLIIGLQPAMKLDSGSKFIITMGSVLLGGLLGELLKLEDRVLRLGKRVEVLLRSPKAPAGSGPSATHAFVSSSLLFCVGPMSIMGSFQEGLKGDATILLSKAVIDGVISIALAASLGYGVGFSALTLFLYQGLLTVFAVELQPHLVPAMLDAFSTCGGILLIMTSLNLLGLTKIKVTNFLPALFFAALVADHYWI